MVRNSGRLLKDIYVAGKGDLPQPDRWREGRGHAGADLELAAGLHQFETMPGSNRHSHIATSGNGS